MTECPQCTSRDVTELGRVESNEFGNGNPPDDMIVKRCGYCGHEWEVPKPGSV